VDYRVTDCLFRQGQLDYEAANSFLEDKLYTMLQVINEHCSGGCVYVTVGTMSEVFRFISWSTSCLFSILLHDLREHFWRQNLPHCLEHEMQRDTTGF
jgi:hypothetical protein